MLAILIYQHLKKSQYLDGKTFMKNNKIRKLIGNENVASNNKKINGLLQIHSLVKKKCFRALDKIKLLVVSRSIVIIKKPL